MGALPLDELRPMCPVCRGVELKRVAPIGDPLRGECEGVVYDCLCCGRVWIDQFTGAPLVLVRRRGRDGEELHAR